MYIHVFFVELSINMRSVIIYEPHGLGIDMTVSVYTCYYNISIPVKQCVILIYILIVPADGMPKIRCFNLSFRILWPTLSL